MEKAINIMLAVFVAILIVLFAVIAWYGDAIAEKSKCQHKFFTAIRVLFGIGLLLLLMIIITYIAL